MTIVSGTYLTFDAKGLREQLSDGIHQISPEETPFQSMAGRDKASAVLFEWQVDALAAAVSSNQQIEGDDVTFATPTATTRLGNYVNISYKTLILSGTLEAVNKAGRRSELALQLAKRSAEIKRDIEKASLENIAASAGNSSTPRKSAGLLAFLKTNINYNTGDGANPSYTSLPNSVRTDGTLRTFAESHLQDVVQKVYVSGGNARYLMVPPVLKPDVSAFSGIATKTFNRDAEKPTAIIGAADVYVHDFGKLSVLTNRFMRARDALFIDPEYVAFMYLRPFRTVELARTGDAEKRMLVVEWGLKVHNEAAHGAAFDLQT